MYPRPCQSYYPGTKRQYRRKRSQNVITSKSQMAVCRCRECGPPKGLVRVHLHRHNIANIEPPVFCGRTSCMKPAVIWLTDNEHERYGSGERVFTCGRRKVVLA